jgi:hypothetical protein
VVISGKENYLEWSRNIEHNLIFNDIWDEICDGNTKPTKLIADKEISIWTNKHNKSYSFIYSSVSEEVSHHMVSIKYSWSALKNLKDMYDSHSRVELIQLLMNLFNLEMKDNNPMFLASKIKFIMHDIDASRLKIGISLKTFIKSLYPTYSHYIESL